MTFTLDLADPRSQRALMISADAGQWLRVRTAEGEVAYGIPSCRIDGRYYLVTASSCDCEDFRRNGLRRGRIFEGGEHTTCKHVRAVQIFEALQVALSDSTCQTTVRQRRHLQIVGGSAS